jgi:hypothetical protein
VRVGVSRAWGCMYVGLPSGCGEVHAELPARVQVAHRSFAGGGRPVPRMTRGRFFGHVARVCRGRGTVQIPEEWLAKRACY